MFTLVKQELFKVVHKPGTWVGAGIMVGAQLVFAVLGHVVPKVFSGELLFNTNFVGGALFQFLAIAITAGTLAAEFQYGTIRQLLYRKYSRVVVYLSKIIGVLLHLTALWLAQLVLTLVLTATTTKISLGARAGVSYTVLTQFLVNQVGEFVGLLLILSVVLLASTLFKSNVAAITTGFVLYFGLAVMSGFLLVAVDTWTWLKWTPFNMMFVANQIGSPSLSVATHLTLPVIVVGALVYTGLFGWLGYLSFRRRAL